MRLLKCSYSWSAEKDSTITGDETEYNVPALHVIPYLGNADLLRRSLLKIQNISIIEHQSNRVTLTIVVLRFYDFFRKRLISAVD